MTDKFLMLLISGNILETKKISEMILSVCPSMEIKIASSGKEAFFLLKEYKKENRPSAAVIDYMLPDITGLDFFRIIKESPKYAGMPVLVMSGTYIEPGDRAAALFAGAASFIQKPAFAAGDSEEQLLKWGESFCRELAYQLNISYTELKGIADGETDNVCGETQIYKRNYNQEGN